MLQPRGYRGLRDESPQRAGPPEVADRQGETAPELRFLERIVRMMLPLGERADDGIATAHRADRRDRFAGGLAAGGLTVLRPFLSALLWALILSLSSWPLYAWLVQRLNGQRSLAAFLMTLLVAAVFILPLAAAGTGLADSVAKVGGMIAVLLKQGPPSPPGWVAELPIVGPQLLERWLEVERLGAGWTAELQPYLDTGLNWLLGLGMRLGETIL